MKSLTRDFQTKLGEIQCFSDFPLDQMQELRDQAGGSLVLCSDSITPTLLVHVLYTDVLGIITLRNKLLLLKSVFFLR